jgi:hypothetical protein
VDKALRRDIVVGFFDTVYWTRRFRNAMERKRQSRLTMTSTFTIPEIQVDDEDIANAQPKRRSPTIGSTLAPPVGLYAPGRSLEGTKTRLSPTSPNLRTNLRGFGKAYSIQTTPQDSAKRTTPLSPSPLAGSGDWQFASALSRPASPRDEQLDPIQAGGFHSRDCSTASAEKFLEVLEDSAWGESIRRSFTQKRRS